MAGKFAKKTSTPNSEEFEAESSPGLKELLSKPEGVYLHTRMREGILKPVDYRHLALGIEIEDEHSAIAGSQSSSSSINNEAFVYMAGSPEEIARRLEEQAREKQAQQEMMQAQ